MIYLKAWDEEEKQLALGERVTPGQTGILPTTEDMADWLNKYWKYILLGLGAFLVIMLLLKKKKKIKIERI